MEFRVSRRSQQQSTSLITMSTTGCAYALSRKLVLLTRNHRDLGKVPELLIEDWTV
ncbi:hypothetical protein GTQ43_02265 [Nostoc sp. KVJ3]|uniref:hypothetical protein n=1 Tax=Nostoc sp. KVJ3 TaxID=457945 RepID=UPI0022375537|nr:hypothetical protein [Nostoc sp. KVJ3]MCW5312712.1 hypothetical protein [Nostoc sp. KVJ3]